MFFLENLIAKSKEHVVNWLMLQSELVNSIMRASKKYNQKNYATKKGDLWEVDGMGSTRVLPRSNKELS